MGTVGDGRHGVVRYVQLGYRNSNRGRCKCGGCVRQERVVGRSGGCRAGATGKHELGSTVWVTEIVHLRDGERQVEQAEGVRRTGEEPLEHGKGG